MGLLGACTAPAPLPTPTPIGAHQKFSGLVNGAGKGAVVTTVCPGPTWSGRTGHAAGGQTVAVTQDPTGAGDTGTSSLVFAEPQFSATVVALGTYDTPAQFPTTVEVPCDGTGTVAFLQCFGIIACSSGAPDLVKVTYVNIAD